MHSKVGLKLLPAFQIPENFRHVPIRVRTQAPLLNFETSTSSLSFNHYFSTDAQIHYSMSSRFLSRL